MIYNNYEGDTRNTLYNQLVQSGNLDQAMYVRGGSPSPSETETPSENLGESESNETPSIGGHKKLEENKNKTFLLFSFALILGLIIGYNSKFYITKK